MKDRFGDLKTILYATEPASYTGILWRYVLFSFLYIPYHTFRLNQIAFILTILAVIGVPIVVSLATGLDKNTIYEFVVLSVLLWGLVLLCIDLWRRYKFSQAEDLWKRLEYHLQLESRKEIFEPKAENNKLTVAKQALMGIAGIAGFIGTILLGTTIYSLVVNGGNFDKETINSAIVTSVSETQTVEDNKSNDDKKNTKTTETKTETKKEQNAPAKTQATTTEKFNKDGYQFTYPSTAEITEQKSDPPYKNYRIQLADDVFVWVTRFKLYIDKPEDWMIPQRRQINDWLKGYGPKNSTCSLEILSENSYALKYEKTKSNFRECYYTFNKNKDGFLVDYIEISKPMDVSKKIQEQIDMIRKSIRFEKP